MAGENRIVVVGGLAAGMSAATQARRIDTSAKITIVETGERISYGICGLPYLISGEIESEKALLYYSPSQLKKERNIEALVNHRATEIRHPQRQLIAESGKESVRIPYDKLILCTGAKASIPFDYADSTAGIFTLRTLHDAAKIKTFIELSQPGTAAVIGSGVLGLEMVDVLTGKGIDVTLIEQAGRPAPGFDSDISSAVRAHLTDKGVVVKCGENTVAVSIDRYGNLEAAVTEKRAIPCDMIVIAAGIVPKTDLAQKCGIQLHANGAIKVDKRMETSLQGIYACGDCASTLHLVSNHDYYNPTATVAVKAGRIAGSNAAGKYAAFNGALGTQGIRLLGWELASTGLNSSEASRLAINTTAQTIKAQANASYLGKEPPLQVTLIAETNSRRLVGAQLFGPQGAVLRAGTLATAITAGMKVDQLEELDLPYAPHISPAWDAILIAAHQLLKKLQ